MFDPKLQEIAEKLVSLCQARKEREGLDTLYAEDAVSVEAIGENEDEKTTKGLDAIRKKHDRWEDSHEIHGATTKGPFLHGDTEFAVIFTLDATNKSSGERTEMTEIAVYTVKDAKIVREAFYYSV